MGDAADDAMDMAEEQYFEYLDLKGRLSKFRNEELVDTIKSDLAEADRTHTPVLLAGQAFMALGICQWYRDKGFLTVKQREALISILAVLWAD